MAVRHYEEAHTIEPELPHYQLNLAAAHLKLSKLRLSMFSLTNLLYYVFSWIEAEQACTKALGQHRSGKGYYRRAKARKMLGHADDAMKGTPCFQA
jgi:hypothetical protein